MEQGNGKRRSGKRLARMAAVLAVLAIAVIALWWRFLTGVRAHFPSPDRQYELVLYQTAVPFAMPGDGGGSSPGFFVLKNAAGRVLALHGVEMVGAMREPQWSATSVYVPLEGEWPLPRPIPSDALAHPAPTPTPEWWPIKRRPHN